VHSTMRDALFASSIHAQPRMVLFRIITDCRGGMRDCITVQWGLHGLCVRAASGLRTKAELSLKRVPVSASACSMLWSVVVCCNTRGLHGSRPHKSTCRPRLRMTEEYIQMSRLCISPHSLQCVLEAVRFNLSPSKSRDGSSTSAPTNRSAPTSKTQQNPDSVRLTPRLKP
jgi:hypothetical protein